MFRRSVILFFMLILVGVPVGVIAQDDAETQDLRFFLTFVPNVQFAPTYVTIANGHAADAGLTLIIEHGDENIGVDLIASNIIQFGVISGEQVIMARAGGRPVVYVYEWFQQYPVGVVIPDTVNVETVEDLRGLKVGIPGRFGASYSGFVALLAAHDMTEADVRLEPIGYAAPDMICMGGVDASVVYVNNEPMQVQQRANAGDCGDITSVTVIHVSDHADMVSNGLVTNEETLASNPDLVRAVVQAYDRGLRDVINNPAEAYLISLEFVENLPVNDAFRAALEAAAAAQAAFLEDSPTREDVAASRADLLDALAQQFDDATLIQFRVLMATIDLWDGEILGHTDSESWELTLDILEMMDMLPGDVTLESAYTNVFVPDEPDDDGA